jgi:hypothetical protein
MLYNYVGDYVVGENYPQILPKITNLLKTQNKHVGFGINSDDSTLETWKSLDNRLTEYIFLIMTQGGYC